jgi:hypothetical protein
MVANHKGFFSGLKICWKRPLCSGNRPLAGAFFLLFFCFSKIQCQPGGRKTSAGKSVGHLPCVCRPSAGAYFYCFLSFLFVGVASLLFQAVAQKEEHN